MLNQELESRFREVEDLVMEVAELILNPCVDRRDAIDELEKITKKVKESRYLQDESRAMGDI